MLHATCRFTHFSLFKHLAKPTLIEIQSFQILSEKTRENIMVRARVESPFCQNCQFFSESIGLIPYGIIHILQGRIQYRPIQKLSRNILHLSSRHRHPSKRPKALSSKNLHSKMSQRTKPNEPNPTNNSQTDDRPIEKNKNWESYPISKAIIPIPIPFPIPNPDIDCPNPIFHSLYPERQA